MSRWSSHGDKRYKTREVLLGFIQTKGEDYTECYSPVAKDSTVRTAFAITLYNDDWVCDSADVEAAFLNPKGTNQFT